MRVFERSSNTSHHRRSMSIRRTPIAVATGLSPYAHSHAHTAAVMALAPALGASSRLALVLEAGARHVEETEGKMDYLKGMKKTIQKAKDRVYQGPPPGAPQLRRQKASNDVPMQSLEEMFGNLSNKKKDDEEQEGEEDVIDQMLEQAEREDMAAKEEAEQTDEEGEEVPAFPKLTRNYTSGEPPKGEWAFGNM